MSDKVTNVQFFRKTFGTRLLELDCRDSQFCLVINCLFVFLAEHGMIQEPAVVSDGYVCECQFELTMASPCQVVQSSTTKHPRIVLMSLVNLLQN